MLPNHFFLESSLGGVPGWTRVVKRGWSRRVAESQPARLKCSGPSEVVFFLFFAAEMRRKSFSSEMMWLSLLSSSSEMPWGNTLRQI